MGELKDRARDVVEFLKSRCPVREDWGRSFRRCDGSYRVECGGVVGYGATEQRALEEVARQLGWRPGDGLPKTTSKFAASIPAGAYTKEIESLRDKLKRADSARDMLCEEGRKAGLVCKELAAERDVLKKENESLRTELACMQGVLKATRLALRVPRGRAIDKYAEELVSLLESEQKRPVCACGGGLIAGKPKLSQSDVCYAYHKMEQAEKVLGDVRQILGVEDGKSVTDRARKVMERDRRCEFEFIAVKHARRKLSSRCPLPEPGKVAWICVHRPSPGYRAPLDGMNLQVFEPTAREGCYYWRLILDRGEDACSVGLAPTIDSAKRAAEHEARRVWFAMNPKKAVVK